MNNLSPRTDALRIAVKICGTVPKRCSGRANAAITLARALSARIQGREVLRTNEPAELGARGDRALGDWVTIDGLPDLTIEGVESPALRGWSSLLNPNVDLLLKGHIQILVRSDAIGKIVARELQHAEIIAIRTAGIPA
ncbi:MAG: hypothetical protein ACLPSW_20045 [Roseiarcus sp.]